MLLLQELQNKLCQSTEEKIKASLIPKLEKLIISPKLYWRFFERIILKHIITNKLLQKSEVADLNYWDLIAFLNIDLCLLMILEDENTDSKWDEIIRNFKNIWDKAGSVAKQAAELEHFDFLTHSLNIVAGVASETYSPNKDLDSRIGELKTALGNMRNKLRSQKIENLNIMDNKEEIASNKQTKTSFRSKSKN